MTRYTSLVIDALRGPLAVVATATALAFSSWPAVVLGLAWLAFYAVDKLLVMRQNEAVKAEIAAYKREVDDKLARVMNKVGVRL